MSFLGFGKTEEEKEKEAQEKQEKEEREEREERKQQIKEIIMNIVVPPYQKRFDDKD